MTCFLKLWPTPRRRTVQPDHDRFDQRQCLGRVHGGNGRWGRQPGHPELDVLAGSSERCDFDNVARRPFLPERRRNQRIRLHGTADDPLRESSIIGPADTVDYSSLQHSGAEELLACPLLCLRERGKFRPGRARDVRGYVPCFSERNVRIGRRTEFLRNVGYRLRVLVRRQPVLRLPWGFQPFEPVPWLAQGRGQ